MDTTFHFLLLLGCQKIHEVPFLNLFSEVIDLYLKKSINNTLPTLFTNLLPSFSELNNFSFVEGPVFIIKKLIKMLIYSFICIEHHTTQGVWNRTKQVKVWWCKISDGGCGNTPQALIIFKLIKLVVMEQNSFMIIKL